MRPTQLLLRTRFQSSKLFCIMVLVGLLLLLTAALMQSVSSQINEPASSSSLQACPTCPTPTQQVIYAPLIGLPEASRSEIVLNCRSPQPIDVTPTFYTAEGTPIVGQAIRLQPAEMRFVDVLSLIPEEHRYQHRWGGMSLSYTGKLMEAWAQLTLHGIGGRNSADVLFAVVDAPRSNVREAVWRMPQSGTAAIALGNYSDSPTQATLTFSDGERQEVNIAPYVTEIVLRRASGRRDPRRANMEGESVTINSNGQLGRLITSGLVTSADGDFTSSLRFYDTQNIAQPNLYATNFRLKNSEAHLLLRNTTANAVTARSRFLPATGAAGGVVELPAVTVPPNEIVEVNLRPLMTAARRRQDFDSVSVQITNSGAQGSLIGALYSTNKLTGITYDIPLRDSGLARNSAGGYPVRLDSDYTTILSITNVSDKPSKFTMQINYEGGRYALYPQELAAGAMATFDVRKIRDEQMPDSTGEVLPRTMSVGQIRWSINGDSSTRLIGRSEVVSLLGKVSSSYSCGVCCPNSVFDGRVIPDTAEVFVDDTTQFAARERDRDCYGNIFPEYPVTADFTSGDYSIAEIWAYPYGVATGMDEGDTFIQGSWTATRWMENLNSMCEDSPVAMAPIADMAVRLRPDRIQVVSDTGQVAIAACPSIITRQVEYQIISSISTRSRVVPNVSFEEVFSNQTTNTCGNGQPTAPPCATTSNGHLFDTVSITCGGAAGAGSNPSCGFTQDQTLRTCGRSGNIRLSFIPMSVRANEILLNDTTRFTSGTILPK